MTESKKTLALADVIIMIMNGSYRNPSKEQPSYTRNIRFSGPRPIVNAANGMLDHQSDLFNAMTFYMIYELLNMAATNKLITFSFLYILFKTCFH